LLLKTRIVPAKLGQMGALIWCPFKLVVHIECMKIYCSYTLKYPEIMLCRNANL